jgi:hypothetical protein
MEADALDVCDIIEVFDDAHGLNEVHFMITTWLGVLGVGSE